MNKYLIIAIIILATSLSIFVSKWKDAVDDADRWESNSAQIENYYKGEISLIKLEKSEFKQTMADSTKKLLDSLKIKPKKVIEYITVHHYDEDTSKVIPKTVQLDDSTYSFKNRSKCFNVEGIVITNDPSYELTITKKEYFNTDQYFLLKDKDTFCVLGIKIKKFWKKSHNSLKIVSECGESQVRRIEISE